MYVLYASYEEIDGRLFCDHASRTQAHGTNQFIIIFCSTKDDDTSQTRIEIYLFKNSEPVLVGHMEIEVGKALVKEDYAAAMQALAALREPVDAFFDKVLVNSDVAAERENRLRLLIKVRDAMGRVADFSQVTG